MRLLTRGGLVVCAGVMIAVFGGRAGDAQWVSGGAVHASGRQLLRPPFLAKANTRIVAAARGFHANLTPHAYAGKSWISPRALMQPLVYISDFSNDVVNIYLQAGKNQTPVGVLSGLANPQGLHVSRNGDLYVVLSGAAMIQVYHRGQTTPFETLNDSSTGAEAVSVTVDSKGKVYVGHLGANIISVFAKGSLTPTHTITDPHASSLFFIAADSIGNVFASNFDSNGIGHVDVFSRGKVKQLPMTLLFPGGVKVDKNDNLLVDDQSALTISTYAPPYTSPPTNVMTLTGDPVSFTLTSSEQAIWDANAVNVDGEEYSYLNNPSGPPGTLLDVTSTSGLSIPIDAACDPPGQS
jgi:hypothetical protein